MCRSSAAHCQIIWMLFQLFLFGCMNNFVFVPIRVYGSNYQLNLEVPNLHMHNRGWKIFLLLYLHPSILMYIVYINCRSFAPVYDALRMDTNKFYRHLIILHIRHICAMIIITISMDNQLQLVFVCICIIMMIVRVNFVFNWLWSRRRL